MKISSASFLMRGALVGGVPLISFNKEKIMLIHGKKLIRISILILLFMFTIPAGLKADVTYCNTLDEWVTKTSGCWNGYPDTFYSYYGSESAAEAARTAEGYTGNLNTYYDYDGVEGLNSAYGQHGPPRDCGAGSHSEEGLFFWKDVEYDDTGCGEAPSSGDEDGDGIDDIYDPYPNDPEEFQFNITYEIRDSNGDLQYYCIEDSKAGFHCFGDEVFAGECHDDIVDCDTKMYLKIGDGNWDYSSTQLGSLGGSYDVEITTEQKKGVTLVNGEVEVEDAVGIDSGVESSGTETDNEALVKIVDNTGKISKNQQDLANLLKGIQRQNDDERQALVEIRDTIKDQSNDITVSVDSDEIGDDIDERQRAYDDEQETTLNSELATGNYDHDSGDFPTDYDQGDIPSKSLLTSVWDSFLSNNPLSTAITGTTLDVGSSACSFNVNLTVLGVNDDITFSMCDWEGYLDTFGALIFSMTSLASIVLIVRR